MPTVEELYRNYGILADATETAGQVRRGCGLRGLARPRARVMRRRGRRGEFRAGWDETGRAVGEREGIPPEGLSRLARLRGCSGCRFPHDPGRGGAV